MLQKYSKAELKMIVEIYNMNLDEKSLKKKKADLIKAMTGEKKTFNEKEVDKKLAKAKAKPKGKAKKDDPKQPKINKAFHKMPDGTKMSGKTHTKDSKPVKK
jgi:hypothetical protein